MTVAAVFTGLFAALLFAAMAVRGSAPDKRENAEDPASRELRALADDLRTGELSLGEYHDARDRLAARMAAEHAGPEEQVVTRRPRRRTPAWLWAAGGLLAAGIVAAALLTAVRQRGPNDFSTGNDQAAATTAIERGAAAWTAAEQAMGAGDGRRAVAQYRRAVSLLPQRSDLRVRLGFALAQVNRPEEAVTQLRFAVRRAPELPDARLYLGAVLLSADRPDEAATQWQRYLRLSPAGPSAEFVRGELRRLEKKESQR